MTGRGVKRAPIIVVARVPNALALKRAGLSMLVLTYGDCSFKAMRGARASALHSFADVRPILPLGTARAEAHRALFRMLASGAQASDGSPSLVSLAEGWGWQVIGITADPSLAGGSSAGNFREFHATPVGAAGQFDLLLDRLDMDEPFLGFVDLGETRWNETGSTKAQGNAVERVDPCLPRVLSSLPKRTLIVVTGDLEVPSLKAARRKPDATRRPIPFAAFRLDGEPLP
jgi:hypothetical protein